MVLLTPPPDPTDPARLQVEADRTCDRLRSMSLVRLAAPRPHGPTRAGAAFALAATLADARADLVGRPRRQLPELPDPAAGDVLAVCANDLVEAVRTRPGDPDAARICGDAVRALIALRRDL